MMLATTPAPRCASVLATARSARLAPTDGNGGCGAAASRLGGNWKEFYLAARDGDFELVSYRMQIGVDVNYAHPEIQSTALAAAILAGKQEVAQYLLDNSADPLKTRPNSKD